MAGDKFDLAVIGGDLPGLAAAGCSAATGAKVVLIATGKELPGAFYAPKIPNFAWRMLGLPAATSKNDRFASRRTQLLDHKGRAAATIETYPDVHRTMRALGEIEPAAAAVWTSFLDASRRRLDTVGRPPSATGFSLDGGSLSSAHDVLDDYFQTEELKTHIAAMSLLSLGLAGDEPGSCAALSFLSAESWPVETRIAEIGETIGRACLDHGVIFADGVVSAIAGAPGKMRQITLSGGDVLQAKTVMAASASDAAAANAPFDAGGMPIVAPVDRARGVIRMDFASSPMTDQLTDDAVYYLLHDRAEILRARDLAAEGELAADQPLILQARERTISVEAPFCPVALADEQDSRSWTGQDRQSFGRMVFERIKTAFGVKATPTRIDVRIDTLSAPRQSILQGAPANDEIVAATPQPSADAVAAATRMALMMVGHD